MKEFTLDPIKKENYNNQGFVFLKQFIPIHLVEFFKTYFDTLKYSNRLLKGDSQSPNSLCTYGDPCFDTLLLLSTGLISEATGIKLLPTYTYARIYLTGSELLPHIDRDECEHSVTLFLGGEYDVSWPIFIENKNKNDMVLKFDLEPGDAVIYQGNKLEHWREKFTGKSHYQLFMHYVDSEGSFKNNYFDKRPFLGVQ